MTTRSKNTAVLILAISAVAQFYFAYVAYAQTVAPESAINPTTSRNWAGYVADGGNYTSVSGSWTVTSPSLSVNGSDAAWIGIGGVHSRDLLQVGTQALVVDGSVKYSAWYEALPGLEIVIPIAVTGGDKVSASVVETSAGLWHLHIQNDTNGQIFDKDVLYNSSRSSAEWIQEKPTGVGFSIVLDDFGTVSFSGGAATVNGTTVSIADAGAHALQMANRNDEIIASVSALGTDGSSFTVNRTSAGASPVSTDRERVYQEVYGFVPRHTRRNYQVYIVQSADGYHVYLVR